MRRMKVESYAVCITADACSCNAVASHHPRTRSIAASLLSARSIRNFPVVYASLLRKHSAAGFVHVVAALVKLWQCEAIITQKLRRCKRLWRWYRCRCLLHATVCLIYTTHCQSSSISGRRRKRKRWWGLVQYRWHLRRLHSCRNSLHLHHYFVGILYSYRRSLLSFQLHQFKRRYSLWNRPGYAAIATIATTQ